MTTCFIADLHLGPQRPDITAAFLTFLERPQRPFQKLYILGDLFDAWLGDDDTSEFAQTIQRALAAVSQRGVEVYFIAGNRDFMVGERWAKACGITLLNDSTTIDLYGTPTLIMHGDTLCSDDLGYQRYRKIIQHPWVKGLLGSLPLRLRMAIANKLRQQSSGQVRHHNVYSLRKLDAVHQTVVQNMQQAGVTQLIHGHTHRPAIHTFALASGAIGQRIVLGDWYQQSSVLYVDDTGPRLVANPLPAHH
ncbi:UDP-2,3-diacylglucosamine diphosphatase [Idiomarina tyrosinivorans]|uniref:UDP-2,3-diacylglucosamine hydrolase n=1 Tax=Idiomarina tyrosinivorans TaxID=1445662 RepID=A0A432ZPB2_9GAMM|nr:UDP-2,3-diacylglucosamine diphosphatase [Idiomarina tyrosinivorans]RUO79730.1 UDP-2,3-diacylglucosamine diphosphatase [Idiomarina tyrosinivorans]